jgi:phosphoglycolate phosphatase
MNTTQQLWGVADRPDLVIFDLDGTLVDSLADLTASINFMRATFNLPALTFAEVQMGIGKGARNLVEKSLPPKERRIDQALAIFLQHNGAHLVKRTCLYPGADELLVRLSKSNIPLALVSNKNTLHCRQLLEQLGIARYFREVLGGDAVASCKPSPQPLLETMERSGARHDRTVMVGDSSNDFAAARSAGVYSIGCSFGYGEPWELELADTRIGGLEELLPLPWL